MLFCGIDIGTTNTKGIVLDEKGDVLSSVCISNPEMSTEVFWFKYFAITMDKFQSDCAFTSNKIYCGITSQGGSFLLVNKKLQPVSDMYLWTDSESSQQYADSYIKGYGRDEFYHATGWVANGWLPVFKLKGIERGTYDRIAFVPDFISGQLAGELITDITNAQITGLCDFQNKRWSNELITWTGIEKLSLPEICDSLQVIFSDLHTRWGKLNIVTSSHDQYAAMNAVSLEVDKDIMLASGTAWVVNSRRSLAIYDIKTGMLHPGRDIAADNYGNISVVGSMIGKGFHDFLCSLNVDYCQLKKLESEILSVKLPTKTFNVSNYDTQTQKPVLIKRYMEWMASVVKSHLVTNGFMPGLEEIILTGGAANSRVLPQVLADVCGVKVKTIVFPALTAYGAAKFAAQAVGVEFEKSIDDISASQLYLPVNQEVYKKWYDIQISSSFNIEE